jgi:hypothetical protein
VKCKSLAIDPCRAQASEIAEDATQSGPSTDDDQTAEHDYGNKPIHHAPLDFTAGFLRAEAPLTAPGYNADVINIGRWIVKLWHLMRWEVTP